MRNNSLVTSVSILFAILAFVFTSPARADDDPPGRVARLNYIQGSISFQPGGVTDWVQANPNRPLTTGDNLWADHDSRGELHIGSSSIRIGSETGITFLNLDDRTVQIQLAQGSLNVNVRRLDGGDDFEIDTPNLAFTLQRPGNYRVDVDPNGNVTNITVRSGEGEATGAGNDYHMDSGATANFSGTDSLTYDGGQAGGLDDFDSWCQSRDEREERSQSARYVSRDVPGYDDLDDNGEWRDVPEYGNVWFPTQVAIGWAPYRYGHWAYVAPWGWTWVEDEPWGFAPFHYGRWAEVDNRWCWVPGPMVVRPVYAPALVVFVGGPRFGMSLAFGGGGGVAWFPLGPREMYVPPYQTSERYMQRVNATNTTINVITVNNIYNHTTVNTITYMHQNNVAAVTAVSHDTFVGARPVAAANLRVNQQQLQSAEVQHNFTVAPVQKSVVGASAPSSARPPAAVMNRQVVVKETPAPVRPAFNSNAPQPNKTFRQASAPPAQQQQQRQQPGPQQRPGQFSPPAQQQPQTQQRQMNATPSPSQLQRPQTNANTNPPANQRPPVKFAPPAKTNEDTYHPHQFERPQTAAPPAASAPAPQSKEQPKAQGREQGSKKPSDQKEKDKK